jgi:hypothetical protein
MTSIFNYSRQNIEEEPEEIPTVFKKLKEHKQSISNQQQEIEQKGTEPDFIQNMEQEEQKIKQNIQEAEEYEKETIPQTAKREVLGHAARAGEGFLGGITSFLNMLTPDLELEDIEGNIETHKPVKLPEANELREFTKKQTGEYLEPKGEFSKSTQEIASDIGSMFSTPGLGFFSKLLIPIGSQVTKQSIKASGGSEESQNLGKLGFSLISTIAGLGNAPKMASRALNEAENLIPKGVSFSAKPIEESFKKIKNKSWFQTGRTSSKGPAMDEMKRIEDLIKNGKIDAHKSMQLRRDINEVRKDLGAFTLVPKVADKKAALAHLNEVDKALLSAMENYGRHLNPKWLKQYKLGNEAYKVTQRSRNISDFIEKHAKPLKSETARTLFHVAGASSFAHAPALAAGATPIVAGAKLIQLANRMIKSPVLRNHYLKVVASASAGNAALMKKELDKFDLISEKLEKKSNPQQK